MTSWLLLTENKQTQLQTLVHSSIVSRFRNFLAYLAQAKVLGTNPNCVLKTEVVCDRSPGLISFDLIPAVAGKMLPGSFDFNPT